MEIHRDQEYVSVPWAFFSLLFFSFFFFKGSFSQPGGDMRLVGGTFLSARIDNKPQLNEI